MTGIALTVREFDKPFVYRRDTILLHFIISMRTAIKERERENWSRVVDSNYNNNNSVATHTLELIYENKLQSVHMK